MSQPKTCFHTVSVVSSRPIWLARTPSMQDKAAVELLRPVERQPHRGSQICLPCHHRRPKPGRVLQPPLRSGSAPRRSTPVNGSPEFGPVPSAFPISSAKPEASSSVDIPLLAMPAWCFQYPLQLNLGYQTSRLRIEPPARRSYRCGYHVPAYPFCHPRTYYEDHECIRPYHQAGFTCSAERPPN